MTLRILSLAEADLLDGFAFTSGKAAALVGNFSNHLTLTSNRSLYAGTHRRVLGYHRMLSKRFPFAIYYDLHRDEIRIWRVLDCRRDPRWLKVQVTRGRKP